MPLSKRTIYCLKSFSLTPVRLCSMRPHLDHNYLHVFC